MVWKNLETVTRAIAKGDAAAITGFKPTSKTHRKLLLALDATHLTKLVTQGMPSEVLGWVAWQIADADIEQGLRIYDALLAVPLADLDAATPVDATFWLCSALESKDRERAGWTVARAKRYLAHWSKAKGSSLIYLNLVTLALAIGDTKRAVAFAREGILEGDPELAKDLRDKDFDAIRADVKKLAKLEPVIPKALRAMQNEMGRDPAIADALMELDLEHVTAHPEDSPADIYDLGKARHHVRTFGHLPDGGDLAFWKSDPGASLADSPVVLFGSDGNLAVYARDFTGFLVLLASGLALRDVEGDGFHFEDTEWTPPDRTRLSANKRLAKAIAGWDPATKKRKAPTELAAAHALVPSFMAACRPSTRSGGRTKRRRS